MKKDEKNSLYVLYVINVAYAYVEQVLLNIKIITPLKNTPKFLNGLNVLVMPFQCIKNIRLLYYTFK